MNTVNWLVSEGGLREKEGNEGEGEETGDCSLSVKIAACWLHILCKERDI